MSVFGQLETSFYKNLDGKLGFKNDAAGQWNYLVEKGKHSLPKYFCNIEYMLND